MANYTIPSIIGTRQLPWAGDFGESGCNTPSAQSNKFAMNQLPVVVGTVAELKALSVTNVGLGSTILLLGSLTAGDGNGANYYYDPTSVATPDGVNVINPTVGSGNWLIAKFLSTVVSIVGVANIMSYGADPTGTVDSAAAINACIASNNCVFIPAGLFKVSTDILLKDNLILYGVGTASRLKATTNAIKVINGTSVTGLVLQDFVVDGGGQTSDVYTGIHNVTGVYLDNVSNFRLRNLGVTKCGVANLSSPTVDGALGGFGIFVRSGTGATANGVISACTVTNIAGGGNNRGDGIIISARNASPSITTSDVVVENCWVSTCGRHCYSVDGGAGTSVPTDVKHIACYGEKAALSGIDYESSNNAQNSNCHFKQCGADTTYYNPQTVYGVAYNLCAGIALDNDSTNLIVESFHIENCYYGLSLGGMNGFMADDGKIETSTISDMVQLLGNCPVGFRMNKVVCASSGFFNLLFTASVNDVVISECDFNGLVGIAGDVSIDFDSCIFHKNFQTTGTGVAKITWEYCTFLNYPGYAISASVISQLAADCRVTNCKFLGTGTMQGAIRLDYRTSLRWVIEDNTFDGLTVGGVICTNSNGETPVTSIRRNTFLNMPTGIEFTVNGLTNATISDNNFVNISGWCINFPSIGGGAFTGMSINGNSSGASCVNGLNLLITTGSWDYSNIIGNNWYTCSGTRQHLDAGNSHGNVALNIV